MKVINIKNLKKKKKNNTEIELLPNLKISFVNILQFMKFSFECVQN